MPGEVHDSSSWPSLHSSPCPAKPCEVSSEVKSERGAGEGQQLHREPGHVFKAHILMGLAVLKHHMLCLALTQTLNILRSHTLHNAFPDQLSLWLSLYCIPGLKVVRTLVLSVMLSGMSPNYFMSFSCLSKWSGLYLTHLSICLSTCVSIYLFIYLSLFLVSSHDANTCWAMVILKLTWLLESSLWSK